MGAMKRKVMQDTMSDMAGAYDFVVEPKKSVPANPQQQAHMKMLAEQYDIIKFADEQMSIPITPRLGAGVQFVLEKYRNKEQTFFLSARQMGRTTVYRIAVAYLKHKGEWRG